MQALIGRFAIDALGVARLQRRGLDQALALGGIDRPDLALGRADQGALGDARSALFIEQGHQRLAHRQLGDGGFDVQAGVGTHGAGGRLDRFLVARGEGTQRMLHPVAELSQHAVGNVERVLRHEVNAHALGADQPHHLLDLVQQGVGRILEQQMRLVEKERDFGLVQIAGFGQLLKQFGQHPQQEGGVQAG